MLCKFLAVPCVGVFGQMNQFPWEKDGSSSDICPAPCVQQVSTKKLFIRIFDQKKYLEQGFPKFSRNESQWHLTNKKRERERSVLLRTSSKSPKKMFVRIFGKERCLEQSFPKFSINESQWQLTNKKRERYLFCFVGPTSIRTIIPIIADINILVINIHWS